MSVNGNTHLVMSAGIDIIIDSVATKSDNLLSDSKVAKPVDLDKSVAGENATVTGNLSGHDDIVIIGTALVSNCLAIAIDDNNNETAINVA